MKLFGTIRIKLILMVICTFWLTCCSTFVQPSPAAPIEISPQTQRATIPDADLISLGYYTGTQESIDSLIKASSYLDFVSVDVYNLHLDGKIVGYDEFGAAAQNRSDGIRYYACLSNWNADPAVDQFDPQLARRAMTAYRAEVISQLVDLAQKGGYEGINIDFEDIAYPNEIEKSRTDFNEFIHELATNLHQNGKKLMVSVPGKTYDDRNNEWAYSFDLASLGKDADFLQLMTYDQHGPWGAPGPVSGFDWLETCVIYTTSVVDPTKLLIGLPAYGYDWNLGESNEAEGVFSANDISWKDLPSLLARSGVESHWDESSKSPYAVYTENGSDHVVWFENTESIRAKMKLIPLYHLAGFSVWALGKEDPAFWKAVMDEIH